MQWNIEYRPKTLDDVFGADGAKRYIQSIVKTKEWPTAIGFTGQFGCGKTTIAQILAKMIVCKNPLENGDPCGECAECQAVDSGAFNRSVLFYNPSVGYIKNVENGQQTVLSGVEGLEEFLKKATSQSVYGKEKVIIIDEAQVLQGDRKGGGRSSSSLLLKPLESPRPGIHWIFTSMAPINNLALKSRIMNFNFTELYSEDISQYLLKLLGNIKYDNEKSYLDFLGENFDSIDDFKNWILKIAKSSRGSIRNAVNTMQQAITCQLFTVDSLREIISTIQDDDIDELFFTMSNGIKNEKVFSIIEGIFSKPEVNVEKADFNDVLMRLSFNISLAETYRVFNTLPVNYSFLENKMSNILNMKNYNKLKSVVEDLTSRPFLTKSILVTKLMSVYSNENETKIISRGQLKT